MRKIKNMTKSEELKILKSYHDSLTNEQRSKILKEIMGPPRRELVGEEYDAIWLLLKIKGPTSESNNQCTITEISHLSGFGDKPMIEEVAQILDKY